MEWCSGFLKSLAFTWCVIFVVDNHLPIVVSLCHLLGDFKCLVQLIFNLVFTQVRVASFSLCCDTIYAQVKVGKAALGPNWPTLPEYIPVSVA